MKTGAGSLGLSLRPRLPRYYASSMSNHQYHDTEAITVRVSPGGGSKRSASAVDGPPQQYGDGVSLVVTVGSCAWQSAMVANGGSQWRAGHG